MNIARMGLKGRLVIAGALALLVASALIGWGASQQANYKWQAEHEAAENARHADYDVRYRCIPLPPLAERNCTIDRRREQRDYERHEQDLYAQKTAAFWTFLMGGAAIIGMLLSAVGVFLVFFTFGETRRSNILNMRENARSTRRAVASAKETAAALRAARKSAGAADRHVKIAQETAYRQLRAYLSVENVTITKIAAHAISGQLTIRNTGRTPATVALYLATVIGPHPVASHPENAPQGVAWPSCSPFINANSSETIDWFYPIIVHFTPEFGEAEIAKLLADPVGLSLFLYGRIEFTDFQRHLRVLNINYRHHGGLAIGLTSHMVAARFGNTYEDRGIQT